MPAVLSTPTSVRSLSVQAGALYDAVAACGGFYDAPVQQGARSRMNVPFTIPSDKELEAKFLSEASDAGFVRSADTLYVGFL